MTASRKLAHDKDFFKNFTKKKKLHYNQKML